jgi:small subunit ribosomal protein S1
MTSLSKVYKDREKTMSKEQSSHPAPQNEPNEPDEGWWAAVLADEPKIENLEAFSPEEDEEKPSGEEQQPGKVAVNWHKVRKVFANDEILKVKVMGHNRGGILVSGEDVNGFVPASHLIDLPADHLDEDREDYLMDYLGRKISVKIIECEPEKERIVFSERAALAEEGQRKHLLSCLKEGDIIDGIVTNITSFGGFVDLGGVEGLIHVSELSWGRVHHPSEILNVGDRIRVIVLQIAENQGKIALSLKRLGKNPWNALADAITVGDQVKAVVSSIVRYGAFARLKDGVEGLIHISSMNFPEGCKKIDDFLYEGQNVMVSILNMDVQKRRLGLKLESYE